MEKLKRKKGDVSIPVIISLVMVALIVVLVYWGFSTNVFGPVKEKFAGGFNKVLENLGFGEGGESEELDSKSVFILGKNRNLILNDGENRCVVSIGELGNFSLDFNDKGNLKWYRGLNFVQDSPIQDIGWKSTSIYPYDYFFYYSEGDSNLNLVRNFIKEMKIEIDGKSYPLLIKNEGIIANIDGKIYIYSIPEENKDTNIPLLGYYDSKTKKISLDGIGSDVNAKAVEEAFNNFFKNTRISLYGKDNSIFLRWKDYIDNPDIDNEEMWYYHFNSIVISTEYYDLFLVEDVAPSSGSAHPNIYLKLSKSKTEMKSILAEISEKLQDPCRGGK